MTQHAHLDTDASGRGGAARRVVAGLCSAVIAFAALGCSDDSSDDAASTSAAERDVRRFTTEGLTFTYPTELYAQASDLTAEELDLTILVEITPAGVEASTTTVRVMTVRDAEGSPPASLSVSDQGRLDALEAAAGSAPDDSLRLDFVNGTGLLTVDDNGAEFVGQTKDAAQLVVIDVPFGDDRWREDDAIESLEEMIASVFVDATATTLDADECERGVEVTGEVELAPGPVVAPGQQVTATWRVLNTGSCAWTDGDAWVFTGGDPVTVVSVSSVAGVGPGEETEVSVAFAAPDVDGGAAAQWQFQPSGQRQPIGPPVAVVIEVEGA